MTLISPTDALERIAYNFDDVSKDSLADQFRTIARKAVPGFETGGESVPPQSEATIDNLTQLIFGEAAAFYAGPSLSMSREIAQRLVEKYDIRPKSS